MPLYLGSNKIGRVDIIKHLTTDNIQLEQKTVEPLETTHTYYPSGDYDAFSQLHEIDFIYPEKSIFTYSSFFYFYDIIILESSEKVLWQRKQKNYQ